MKPLVIWGTGGHAREVAQLVRDIEAHHPGSWSLKGFVVDSGAASRDPKPLPGPILGGLDWWLAHPDVLGVIAVGDPVIRQDIVRRIGQASPALAFATLIHPSVWLGSEVQIGQGSVVFAHSCINTQVSVGQHASINLACTLSHDTVLGDCVSLGPGVHLCGSVRIGNGSDLGAGVNVIPGVHIGQGVTVGAGAVVIGPLPAGCKASGVPARSR